MNTVQKWHEIIRQVCVWGNCWFKKLDKASCAFNGTQDVSTTTEWLSNNSQMQSVNALMHVALKGMG